MFGIIDFLFHLVAGKAVEHGCGGLNDLLHDHYQGQVGYGDMDTPGGPCSVHPIPEMAAGAKSGCVFDPTHGPGPIGPGPIGPDPFGTHHFPPNFGSEIAHHAGGDVPHIAHDHWIGEPTIDFPIHPTPDMTVTPSVGPHGGDIEVKFDF
jgi:hypothetical protein